mmetsp:Transcript_122740/g.393114  ORF Transcript_122740/g.393114 Transcript_122740/m.393114 type:complete len:212 (-) Transcript_122740:142-777(-)
MCGVEVHLQPVRVVDDFRVGLHEAHVVVKQLGMPHLQLGHLQGQILVHLKEVVVVLRRHHRLGVQSHASRYGLRRLMLLTVHGVLDWSQVLRVFNLVRRVLHQVSLRMGREVLGLLGHRHGVLLHGDREVLLLHLPHLAGVAVVAGVAGVTVDQSVVPQLRPHLIQLALHHFQAVVNAGGRHVGVYPGRPPRRHRRRRSRRIHCDLGTIRA